LGRRSPDFLHPTTTTLAMAGGAIVSHLFYLACNQAFVSFSGVTEGYFDQITRF
jgi:hypothetical protein